MSLDKQSDHFITAQRGEDLQTFHAAGHQSGPARLLQLLGGVGYRQAGHFCQLARAVLALGNKINKLQPVKIAQGFSD